MYLSSRCQVKHSETRFLNQASIKSTVVVVVAEDTSNKTGTNSLMCFWYLCRQYQKMSCQETLCRLRRGARWCLENWSWLCSAVHCCYTPLMLGRDLACLKIFGFARFRYVFTKSWNSEMRPYGCDTRIETGKSHTPQDNFKTS